MRRFLIPTIVLVCLVGGPPLVLPAKAEVLRISAPRETLLGDPFSVCIASAVQFQCVKIHWLGHTMSVPLIQSGDDFQARILLGTDVKHQNPGMTTLRVRGEKYGLQRTWEASILVRDRPAPVQRLTVSKAKVFLSEASLVRHQQEQQAVSRVLNRFSSPRLWTCPFQRPADGEISSAYGLKRVLNGRPRSPHRGVDIRSGDQAEVVAANDGRVALTGDHFFAGKSVYLDHGLGVVSMYFHLSRIAVQEGERVIKGQYLGRTGATGRATGPHLHFGISLCRALVDPTPLFAESCSQHW